MPPAGRNHIAKCAEESELDATPKERVYLILEKVKTIKKARRESRYMRRVFLFIALLMGTLPLLSAECLMPKEGMEINQSSSFCEGIYEVEGILLGGSDVSIVCNETILKGMGQGVGIRIENAKNISVIGCGLESFEVGIAISNSKEVVIERNSFVKNKMGIAWTKSDIREQGNVFLEIERQNTLEYETAEEISKIQEAERKPTAEQMLAEHVAIKREGASQEILMEEVAKALESLKESEGLLEIKREVFGNPDNSTTITLTIIPKEPLQNVSIYEHIPKCVAEYVQEALFSDNSYEIIREDPLLLWTFPSLGDEKEISYTVFRRVSSDCASLLRAIGIVYPASEKERSTKERSIGAIKPEAEMGSWVLLSAVMMFLVIAAYIALKRRGIRILSKRK